MDTTAAQSTTGTGTVMAVVLSVVVMMTGCATNPASGGAMHADPFESVNRHIYTFNDFLDRTIAERAVAAYIRYTPRPIRQSISDFLDNVAYPNVILNDFLQGKARQGFEDAHRFLVNSTFGMLGIWDMATPLGLEAHTEDFGQTLGHWGLDEIFYLVLPFVGPNSVRDAPNLGVSTVTNILFYTSNPFAVPIAILGFIDRRARVDDAIKFRDEAAVEPYLFTREAYRQHRTFLIHDGNPPIEDSFLFDDLDADADADADTESAPSPSPREDTDTP